MNPASIPPEFGDYSDDDLTGISLQLVERLKAHNDSLLQPGDATGLSDEFFDALYTLGVRYYANAQYDKAGEFFKVLCSLKPLEARHFKAWGANYLGLKDYDSAVRAYSTAYMLSATDADTSFYLGQAFYFLKEYEEAQGHLKFAMELAARSPAQWPQIEAWSRQLLERVEAARQA